MDFSKLYFLTQISTADKEGVIRRWMSAPLYIALTLHKMPLAPSYIHTLENEQENPEEECLSESKWVPV